MSIMARYLGDRLFLEGGYGYRIIGLLIPKVGKGA